MANSRAALPIVILMAASVAAAEQPVPSEAQQSAIEMAAAWLRSAHPDPTEAGWPYHFGTSPACVPYLVPLLEPPRWRVEGDGIITEPPRHEGWWLVADLETNRFWLLVSEGYFGPAHYYGPARLTANGELRPEPAPNVDCTGSTHGKPPNLLDLPARAEVEVRYVSDGCFHHEKRTITIRGGPQTVAIVSAGPDASPNGSGGQVVLARRHLEKLSNLLALYRSNPEGECTTRDEVTVTYRMADARDYSEHFVDASCASADRSDVLDLWTLVQWSSGMADPDAPLPGAHVGTARDILREDEHQ